ncbi:MAG: DUF2817 domain-containing protein [Flavobacterium sp.]|nr:MAG: DUF2817 domain-containing protein [Flavobacterium sp.]
MDVKEILANYNSFNTNELKDRFFKHSDVMDLLAKLPSDFTISKMGDSFQNRSISLVKWGNGKTKIMLWSQMHGDEATGTMALFDLVNFLQGDFEVIKSLREKCQLFIIPMVNPDGAEMFTRRNAQQIDINRDYLRQATKEAQILKKCRDDIEPHFGFNLHDQTTLWSVSKSLKPATLSFLAPACDEELSVNETRKNAMQVIAVIFEELKELLPGHIGLFDDEFEPRAFGDNFQKAGMSTILIEAGGFEEDFDKQKIRKFYFTSILASLNSIATLSYQQKDLAVYFAIPKNNKQIFHYLIHRISLNEIEVSVGINYEEIPVSNGKLTQRIYSIQDIGDLSFCDAYKVYDAQDLNVIGNIEIFKPANFELSSTAETILCFENGLLL